MKQMKRKKEKKKLAKRTKSKNPELDEILESIQCKIRVASVSFYAPEPQPINYITFKFEVAGDPARHVYDPLLILSILVYLKMLKQNKFFDKLS